MECNDNDEQDEKTNQTYFESNLHPNRLYHHLFLLNFLLNAAAEPHDHVSPGYEEVDLSLILAKDSLSDTDYETLYRQTGLGRPAVQDLLLLPDGREKIQQFQEDFSACHASYASKTP